MVLAELLEDARRPLAELLDCVGQFLLVSQVGGFMVTRLAVVLIALVATGCVVSDVVALEPEGKKIKLVRAADKPIDCDVVASVSGSSRAQGEKDALRGAENDLRNEASAYDANFVVVEVERIKQAGTGPYKEA